MKTESIEILEKNNLKSDLKKEETSGCCGGVPTSNEEACCKLDEDKKAEGEAGCGCNATAEKSKSTCC
ncbi:hypothetical protein [Flavobacterium sp. 25HG05S-40]|uniref:hypothetical protein n=1 Tax=Flavobacterium sp. 25HG05S-40 TaxID=3458682 RepID=UPI004043C38A